jgi:hypothetical protein
MREHRKQQRHTPVRPLAVRNARSDNHVGFVVNISSGGFMLMTQGEPPCNGGVYELLIEEHSSGTPVLRVGATCLWQSATRSGDGAWCGFQIIDIDEEQQARLNTLLAEMPAAP